MLDETGRPRRTQRHQAELVAVAQHFLDDVDCDFFRVEGVTVDECRVTDGVDDARNAAAHLGNHVRRLL